jgi:hypothetical protein
MTHLYKAFRTGGIYSKLFTASSRKWEPRLPEVTSTMKLLVHASIFSVVFAGFVASAVTIKPITKVTAKHSLVISHAMPVPTCDPRTGCAY